MRLPSPRSRLPVAFLACTLALATFPSETSAQRRGVAGAPTAEQGTNARDFVEAIAPMVFCVAWTDAVYDGLRWQGMRPVPTGSVVSAVLRGRDPASEAEASVAVSLTIQGTVLQSIEWGEHSGGGAEPGASTDPSLAVDEVNAAYQTHRPTGGALPPPFSQRCGR